MDQFFKSLVNFVTKILSYVLQYEFLFAALKSSKNEDTITLQILAELSCLQIFIQDQKRNISEIKIEGNRI